MIEAVGGIAKESMIQLMDFDTLISKNGILTHPFIESKKRIVLSISQSQLKKFLKEHTPKIKRQFNRWFKVLMDTVTRKRVKQTFDDGYVDAEWDDEVMELTRQFFNGEFKPSLVKWINAAGESMAKRLNRELNKSFSFSEIKQMDFNPASENVIKYIENVAFHKITYVREGFKDLYRSVFTFLQDEMFSVQNAQMFLRELLPIQISGLYRVEHIKKYYHAMLEEGIKKPQALTRARVRSIKMRQLRVELISRTELSRAYNYGNQETMRQAVDNGVIKKVRKQRIVMMDGNEQHGDMDNEIRDIDEPYSNGEVVPGESSYNCRCTENYLIDD